MLRELTVIANYLLVIELFDKSALDLAYICPTAEFISEIACRPGDDLIK
jgi:ABC-type phosphate/phosphonate transport system substrate-binding protein